jgi:hypothetical protein
MVCLCLLVIVIIGQCICIVRKWTLSLGRNMRLRLRYLEASLEHTFPFFLCVFRKEGCMRALYRLVTGAVLCTRNLCLKTVAVYWTRHLLQDCVFEAHLSNLNINDKASKIRCISESGQQHKFVSQYGEWSIKTQTSRVGRSKSLHGGCAVVHLWDRNRELNFITSQNGELGMWKVCRGKSPVSF